MTMQHPPSESHQEPGWRQHLDASRQHARAWWNERSIQERKLLRLGTLVVIAALIWTIGLQPALNTIQHAREQLPRLRADAAQVDALIIEAQALQRVQTGKINKTVLSDALSATLQRAGLEEASAFSEIPGATAGSTPHWEISVFNANATRVMEWLASLPYLLHVQTHSVELVRASVDGRDRPGHVTGRITVQQSRRASP